METGREQNRLLHIDSHWRRLRKEITYSKTTVVMQDGRPAYALEEEPITV